MPVSIFGRRKEPDTDAGTGTPAPGGTSGTGTPVAAAPDKAARFFEHAQVAHDAGNYEYAITNWLGGLRQDPTSMRGLESFFQSCAAFLAEKGRLSRETVRMFDGKTDLDRYLTALLNWGMNPLDASLAVKATEAAAALGLTEPTLWIGGRAAGAVMQARKPRKELLLRLVEAFTKVGAFDKAVECCGVACQLDPTDARLAAEMRNLAAQATMTKGGYEQAGMPGGFRASVRDLERQRYLEEAERIVKSEETLDRLIAAAEADYAARPDDPHAIGMYTRRLIERGRPEDEKRAMEVLDQGYRATRQFRFREMWGDLRLRRAQRKVLQYREAAEQNPADPRAQELYRQARAQYVQMEIEEYRLRVENYPTDLGLKFELGRRYFEAGEYEQAIALFQQSQEDARHRVESLRYLGEAFHRIGWVDEAIETFRKALDVHRVHTDDMGMELRYGLLAALQAKAEAERDLTVAEEADKLASAIAIQQINFRDIRARRDALKRLLAELKRGDAA